MLQVLLICSILSSVQQSTKTASKRHGFTQQHAELTNIAP